MAVWEYNRFGLVRDMNLDHSCTCTQTNVRNPIPKRSQSYADSRSTSNTSSKRCDSAGNADSKGWYGKDPETENGNIVGLGCVPHIEQSRSVSTCLVEGKALLRGIHGGFRLALIRTRTFPPFHLSTHQGDQGQLSTTSTFDATRRSDRFPNCTSVPCGEASTEEHVFEHVFEHGYRRDERGQRERKEHHVAPRHQSGYPVETSRGPRQACRAFLPYDRLHGLLCYRPAAESAPKQPEWIMPNC